MMNAMTIRKLSDEVKQGLRIRAAQNGRSMEEEARQILSAAVTAPMTSEGERPKNFLLALRDLVPAEARGSLPVPSRASDRPGALFD